MMAKYVNTSEGSPHVTQLPVRLQTGSIVCIKGTMMPNSSDRFSINLQSGPAHSPCNNVALHLSVRPGEGAIVRNTQQAGVWHTEERYASCPIQVGVPFELQVLAQPMAFLVIVDGVHFCEFAHRWPAALAAVRFVQLGGALSVESVKQETKLCCF